MKIIYGGENLDYFSSDGNIYLSGKNVNNWKQKAIDHLNELQFDGNVYLSNKKDDVEEVHDFAWKNSVAKNSDVVVLWDDFNISFKMRFSKIVSSNTIFGSFKSSEYHTLSSLMERAMECIKNGNVCTNSKVKKYIKKNR